MSPPLVFPDCVLRRSKSVRGNYEAKVLHDPATNDAIYWKRPLSRKSDNKRTIVAKPSKTVRLGRVKTN